MKKQEIVILILVVLVAVFTVCFFLNTEEEPQTVSNSQILPEMWDNSYESRYFNPDKINTLNIIMDEKNWETLIGNPLAKTYLSCTIELNGDVYDNVGIRTAGSSGSLKDVFYGNKTTVRFSFKFNAGKFVPSMTFHGLDKFIIRNMAQDESYVSEYLYYDFAKKLGIKVPLYSYVAVYLNGEYFGLYLMLESIDKSFVYRNYGTNSSVQIYRPGFLEYEGEDPAKYNNLWKTLVFGTNTHENKLNIVNVIKQICSKSDIRESVDLDSVIAYFALNTATVNLDSFINKNNYFLSNVNGILSLIPWDTDLAFGKYARSWPLTKVINFPIDTPLIRTDEDGTLTLKHYPLLETILSTEGYKEKYYALLRYISNNFFGDYISERIDEIDSMIGEYVKADPTKFVSYEEYKKALDYVKEIGHLRVESILGQLNGTIPSTWYEYEIYPNLLITPDK